MATSTWNNTTGHRTVVGYFSNEEDANSAIQDLIAAGFRSASLGAAFPGASSSEIDTELRPATGPSSPDANTSVSGPASGTSAVTSAGLSTGGGTANTGAGRPGPIPGSEIPSELPSTLPHTIQSTLPSTLHPNANAPIAGADAVYPATGVGHDTVKPAGSRNWSDRLKNVFGSEEHASSVAPVDKTSQNFGTGEGHLGVHPASDYAYSDAAFESAFFGMGLEPTHAHHLSSRLSSGGAIVTVETTSAVEANQAEDLLERNRGSVRIDNATSIPASASLAGERRVQLFGRVRSVYPGYVSAGTPTRKAS